MARFPLKCQDKNQDFSGPVMLKIKTILVPLWASNIAKQDIDIQICSCNFMPIAVTDDKQQKNKLQILAVLWLI